MAHVVRKPVDPFPIAGGALLVHQVPAWTDNLVWVLVDPHRREAAVVDGPEAEGVLAAVDALGVRLTTVFTTHTHPDHIGLHRALEASGWSGKLRVVASAAPKDAVPMQSESVEDGDRVSFGDVHATVMRTDGHQDGHVCYRFDDAVFCGDTLFAGGCGYLFDGPPEAMFRSLMRLAALPPETKVCCAHEYTEDNLRFAWSVEPDNDALAARIREVWAVRASGGCTVPSTIGIEQATNPFLRPGSPSLIAHVRAAMPDADLSTPAAVFAATRALKNLGAYKAIADDALPLSTDETV